MKETSNSLLLTLIGQSAPKKSSGQTCCNYYSHSVIIECFHFLYGWNLFICLILAFYDITVAPHVLIFLTKGGPDILFYYLCT